jgi:hypothetical protein
MARFDAPASDAQCNSGPRQKAPQVAGEVVKLVEATINPLDPNLPELRNSCQVQAQTVLKAIIKSFPTVSGHMVAQRLAVGTAKGAIVIYDLRTATRWHVLENVRPAAVLLPAPALCD